MAQEEKINCLRFNDNKTCFICSLDSGVRMYNVDPLVELFNKSSNEIGSIGKAEMLKRTNLKCIVGGGTIPKYADNVLLVYDAISQKFHCEITFTSPVLGIRMLRDRLIVAQYDTIHVMTFPDDMKTILSIDTHPNPLGLVEVACCSPDKYIMCFPAKKCGTVQFVDIKSIEKNSSQATLLLNAHDNELACLSLNMDGSKLATASSKGTLIRVWDTVKRLKLIELRRGSDPATIFCISFRGDDEFLCCSSDKGTIHIFALTDPKLNKRSSFSQMGFLGGCVESQWALATFTVPQERACICAFGPGDLIYAICYDGSFHKYQYKPNGACTRATFDVFLDVTSENYF